MSPKLKPTNPKSDHSFSKYQLPEVGSRAPALKLNIAELVQRLREKMYTLGYRLPGIRIQQSQSFLGALNLENLQNYRPSVWHHEIFPGLRGWQIRITTLENIFLPRLYVNFAILILTRGALSPTRRFEFPALGMGFPARCALIERGRIWRQNGLYRRSGDGHMTLKCELSVFSMPSLIARCAANYPRQ